MLDTLNLHDLREKARQAIDKRVRAIQPVSASKNCAP